ncbi:hypothetical protein FKM82_012721 [Ascaphus truei]
MSHCRKMQERMTAQLAAAERRHRKLESEKSQLQTLEQEHKKLSTRLGEERTKNKHVVLILLKECKLLSGKIVEEAQKLEELISNLEAEKKRSTELEDDLAAEKQLRSQIEAQMEAQIEKQLSEFDTEREQLRAKLCREEVHTKELHDEIDRLQKTIEKIKLSKENDSKPNLSLPRKNKDKHSVVIGSQSVSCQTNKLVIDNDSEGLKKPPFTVPAKPLIVNHVIAGNTKINVCTNSAFVKPGLDRQTTHNDSTVGLPTTHGIHPNKSRIEENGSSLELTSSTSLYPNSFGTSPASPSYLSQSMQSLHSPCTHTTINAGLSPRIQAAKFKFQANANEHDQNGNTTQSHQTRALSPNSRDNLVAKQMARNTVTQVLSRFTSPQGGSQLRPGLSHPMETGTYPPVAGRVGHTSHAFKSTSVSRVDRGNPPPIPPKKPGLLQTPSTPHPQLKAPPNVGGKSENKPITSAPSSSPHGIRVLNEESVSKSSSPQLPPKPTIDIPVASAGCVIPAIGTSQVGAWPSQSPGRKEPACSENSLVIPTTIACNSFINPVNASSCRPCDSDSLLVTASGWSPSLTSLLTSGGPVPLGDRSTLLHQAAAQGNVTLLSMLLNEEGLDIHNLCKDGHSALYSAAENGHTDCVKLLLTSGAHVDATVSQGFTALCTAAAQGHSKCAEVLIAYNADINHVDGGQTPLYLACNNGNYQCVKLLLEARADRSITTNDGCTPIHAAVDTGNVNCLKLLMYYGVPNDENLLNRNDAIDLRFSDLKNTEHISCRKLKPVISAELINHADKDGWTAAHIAASKGFKNCLEILCNHFGLEPERLDNCNRTVHDVATDDCKHLLENLSPKDGCLNSVAYSSMIPLQTLQNFLRLVEQYHNVIFQGPEGSLQEYLVHQLAYCMKQKEEATGFSCDIIKVEVESELSKEQLMEVFINSACLIPVNEQPPTKKKTIIILEKLEKASLSELLGDFMTPLENRGCENPYSIQRANGVSDTYYFHEGCFLMGTVARSHLQGSELLAQQHFRWVQLRWDGEPMQSLLQKFLKRKVLHKAHQKHSLVHSTSCLVQ